MKQTTRGHYYRKQLECQSSVISWSHRSRFEAAAKLIGQGQHFDLLDYGCGDGTFVTMIAPRFAHVVGTDINRHQIEDCQARLSTINNARFYLTSELNTVRQLFDRIVCMETLEHCPEPIVDGVLQDIQRLCKPQGKIIISVPIETGLTFLIKLVFRTLAAWRGLSEYKYYESYSLSNALRMIFSTENTVVERPIYGLPDSPQHSHYGFNWKRCRLQVEKYFTIEEVCFSPVNRLNGIVSSQVWFICSQKS
ncbi:class I SAM-dependent methyltransferase [Leptolyngbya sp. NIES-2104]|uniref:class I SAM-dependent methyltransferase n=1 Tax=Leptolyngbya sp. NIES-2104 TaxID=1552121 RepID=UPI00073F6890|nr:class I SAM-dependent methyltransferase [Leptolyngbya sp. NIES-2104]